MHFADRLLDAIDRTNSIAVVGLDPRAQQLPEALRSKYKVDLEVPGDPAAVAAMFLEFNKAILDLVAGKVAGVKPQVAFYEQYGWQGYKCYQETIRYAREKGLPVIGDVKRGDIATTAEAYAAGHLAGDAPADAVTLNPYMGSDAIDPFLNACEHGGRGIFVLVKTSNKSSVDFQDQTVQGEPLYERVATMVSQWGRRCIGKRGYSSVGAVVGATFPEELGALRRRMPESILLIPGYGAQGGTAAAIKPGLDKDGTGAVVNSSRGIIGAFSGKPGDWREHVAAAVEAMNKDLNAVR